MHRLARAAALLAALVAPAFAQSEAELREQLVGLYRITISQDICSFPLSDEQTDAITRETDRLETQLRLGDAAAQELYDQIEGQMKRQKDSGLCEPSGEWAKAYFALVAKYGK